jgi:tetratricopeptide (TPR) repeat protein
MAEGIQVQALRTGTHGAGSPATPGAAKLQEMFVRAVQLEESSATLEEAMEMYNAILEMKPGHAAACINLGTIFYNQRDFPRAELMYRRATEADPEYALARRRFGSFRSMRMRTTTWRLPTNARANGGAR